MNVPTKRCIVADIIKVAEKAGVSKSTVSRVLNNGYVAPETRERIEQVMRELDYRPSSFAQNIRTRRSHEIAMMIPDLTNSFFTQMYRAIEDVMLRNGYLVVLCETRQRIDNEIRYAETLMRRNIDGLLYFTQQKEKKNQEYFVSLSAKIPVIFMDYAFADIEGIDCIGVKGREITAEAVEMLFRTGKRRIAYMNTPKKNNITMVRYYGYRDGLKVCGLPEDKSRVILPAVHAGSSLIDAGYTAARKLLEQCPDTDAIMTASDQLAVGVIKYLDEKKIQIPEKVAVVGFDDIDLCQVISPKLSTIRQPIREMGEAAAKRLLKRIQSDEKAGKKILFEGQLILRESTGQ